MKKTLIKLLSIMLCSIYFSPTVFADTSVCQLQGDPAKVAQCIYLTGLSDSDNQRWIKVSSNQFNGVVCWGSINQKQQFILEEDYLPLTSSYTLTGNVSICTDASGSNCSPLQAFSISCDSSKQNCTPDNVPVDLSAVKNQYPACNAQNTHAVLIHHKK